MENRQTTILLITLASLLTSCGDKNSASILNLKSGFGLSAETFEADAMKVDQYNSIKITKEPSKVSLNHNVLDGTANSILITGTEVVLDGSREPFISEEGGQLDSIYSLAVDAQTIIVRNKLHLPQAKILLNSDKIVFEDGGVINVTPASFPSDNSSSAIIGQDGEEGIPGGAIKVVSSDIVIEGDLSKARLIANGGPGQAPGVGRNGYDGISLPSFATENYGGNSYKVIYSEALHQKRECSAPVFREVEEAVSRMARCQGGQYVPERGSRQWPTDGGDAVPAGHPGPGGSGGIITVATNSINGSGAEKNRVALFSQALRGTAGAPRASYKGGKAGQPQFAAWKAVKDNHSYNPQFVLITNVTRDGKGVESPQKPAKTNQDGHIQVEPFEPLGRSEAYYKGRLKLIRDLYLGKKYSTVQQILEKDWSELAPLSKNFFDSNKSPVETRARYAILLNRIALQQDYFGRSVNEAPLYALDFRLNQFDAEIEMALTSYYLTEKILSALDSRTLKKEHVASLVAQHQNYIKSESEKQNIRSAKINTLESDLVSLKSQEAAYGRLLADLNRQIEELSRNNVSRRHQVEVLQKNLKVLGALSKVIPAGQPALAAVGTVLDHLGNIPTNGSALDYINHAVTAEKSIENAFSSGTLKRSRADLDAFFDKVRLSKLDNKSNQDKIKYIQQLQRELRPVYEKVAEVTKDFTSGIVPADELQAEVQKIKLSDPLFQAATMSLENLLKQRAEIYKTLQETLQELMSSATMLEESIALSLAAQDEYLNLASFGDSTLRDLVTSIHNMSKDRLLLIYNEVIKAYEYTTLDSLPNLPEFELLKEKTIELATTQDDPKEAVHILKSFYMSFIYKVTIALDSKFNSASPLMLVRNDNVYLDLTEKQINDLNTLGLTQIALDKSVFASHQKNLRIANIEIEKAQFAIDDVMPEKTQKTFVEITHGGEGVLEGEGDYTRTFTYGTANKMHTWGSSFQFLGTEAIESKMKRDESVKGILGLLLRDKNSALAYSPIFAQPAALTTLNVIKRDHGGQSALLGMRIKVSYSFY